jgi:type VI protein secretion system component Hcp
MAETLIFLKLTYDGQQVAKGNAEVTDYSDQIEIESFSWGMTAEHAKDTTDKASTKAKAKLALRTLSLSKFYDQSSIKLCAGATRRKHVQTAVLTFATMVMQEKGQTPMKVMVMEMTDGFIADLKISAAESGKAIAVKEDFSLSFREFKLQYFPLTVATGARKVPKTFAYEAPTGSK